MKTLEKTDQKLDTIHFNSTKSCNLGCTFCYDKAIRGHTENLSVDTIQLLATDAAELGARRVILSGGEPLLRRDFKNVAKAFDSVGMEVSLATNGTLITDEIVEFLGTLNKVTLSISLDGGEVIHDRLRGQKGAHHHTMRAFELLKQAQINFDVNSTIFKGNLSEIPFLTKLSRDFDCNVRFSLLHPNGRGEDMIDKELTPEEILRLREYCHILRKFGVKVFVNLPPLLQYLEEIIPSRGAACGWAVNFCGVLANGDVSICGVASDEPSLVAGNIKEKRFKEIWTNSPLFQKTRSFNVTDLKGICGRCLFREFCGGACRLSAFRDKGDFLAPYSLCQHFYDEGYIPEEMLESFPEREVSDLDRTEVLAI
jgi:radical SAM protein with 4Fe4S-binding SPASM domain